MADETFPHEESGLVDVPQEPVLLPSHEVAEVDWPVHEVGLIGKLAYSLLM